MKENLVNKLKAIHRTAEIILEHQSSRSFKNSLITVAAQNIKGICEEALLEIEEEKAPEPPTK